MSVWFDLYGAEPTRDTHVVAAWAVDGHDLGVVLNDLPADGPVHPAVQTIYPDRIESVCETTGRILVSLTFEGDDHETAIEAAAIVATWGCTFMVLRTGGAA